MPGSVYPSTRPEHLPLATPGSLAQRACSRVREHLVRAWLAPWPALRLPLLPEHLPPGHLPQRAGSRPREYVARAGTPGLARTLASTLAAFASRALAPAHLPAAGPEPAAPALSPGLCPGETAATRQRELRAAERAGRAEGSGGQKRRQGDSDPCGLSPLDFESISLTARPLSVVKVLGPFVAGVTGVWGWGCAKSLGT